MANIAEVVVIVYDLHKTLRKNQIPVEIADIKSAISDSTETEIKIVGPQDWNRKELFGSLLRYLDGKPKRAVVMLKESLNRCWKRFVACKEMAHLLIDKEENFTKDPIALVESFLTMMPPEKIDSAITSEYWAFVAAIEILVPWSSRSSIVSMIQSGNSTLDIATKYLVPARIIEYWRTPHYQRLMIDAWKDAETEHEIIRQQSGK